MAVRICPKCKAKIPASEWLKHKQKHHNATKARTGKEPEWLKARKRALERDGYRCRRCGRNKRLLDALGVQLHVHHADGNPNNNALGNLETLCDPCHPRGGRRPTESGL